MSIIYTAQSISGYNATPPPDDGSTGSDNEITWAKHKTKLADPIKTLSEAIDSELQTAFGKVHLNGRSAKTTTYTVLASDRGKLIDCTSGTFTVTLLAAATATNGYEITILNSGTGVITIDGNASELINGSTTLVLQAGGWAHVVTDGSLWAGVTYELATQAEVTAGTDAIKVVTSATLEGIKASQAEVNTGTNTKNYVTPETLENKTAPDFRVIKRNDITASAVATGTTVMNADDTIPQVTEGDQYMSHTYTPVSTSSVIRIEVILHLATTHTTATGIAGLFLDGAADAVAAGMNRPGGSNSVTVVTFNHTFSNTSLSNQVWTIRAGFSGAATTTFNGVSGGRLLGGYLYSTLRVTEYA